MSSPIGPPAPRNPNLHFPGSLSGLGPAFRALALLLALLAGVFLSSPAWAQGGAGGPEPGLRGGATMPGGGNAPPASVQGSGVGGEEQVIPNRPSGSSSTGVVAFFLVVVLCLFGFHLFTSHGLNMRLDRLEEVVRQSGGELRERDQLVPFSWDAVLRTLEGGVPFFPGVSLPRPGLVLTGVATPGLQTVVLANLARNVLQDPELLALLVTRSLGPDELGRRLLSLESGKDWRALGPEERRSMLQGTARDLQRYERSLYCMTDLVLTPRQLFDTCQDLLKDGELGAVLLDGLEVLVPGEEGQAGDLLDHLRLLAARCHVPVHLVVSVGSPLWQARNEPGLFLAVAEIPPLVDGTVGVVFHRFPGQAPELTLRLDQVSGRLDAAQPAAAGA